MNDEEYRGKTKSGEYRWFRSTGRMTYRKDGTQSVFYGMFMDINEQKKKDAELLWRDTLADVITRNLDSVYFILNKQNRDSVYVSPSIEPILGLKKDMPHPLLAIQNLERDPEKDFSVEKLTHLPVGQSLVQDCWITPVGSNVTKMFQKTVYHVARESEDLLIFEFTDHTHEQEVRKSIEDVLDMSKIESGGTLLNVEKFNLLDQIREIETLIRPQTSGIDTFDAHISIG